MAERQHEAFSEFYAIGDFSVAIHYVRIVNNMSQNQCKRELTTIHLLRNLAQHLVGLHERVYWRPLEKQSFSGKP
jgi:hypothetical protein